MCIDNDDENNAIKQLASETTSNEVLITLEYCWETAEDPDDCLPVETARQMFAAPVYINDFHHFVNLKNQTDPLQWTTNLITFNLTD